MMANSTRSLQTIAILTHDYPPMGGGISHYALGLKKAFDAMGIKCRVLFFPIGSSSRATEEHVTTVPIAGASNLLRILKCCIALLRYRRLIRQSELVIVLTWSPVGVAYWLLPSAFKPAAVLMAHGNDILEPGRSVFYRKLMKRVFNAYPVVCTNSSYTADLCRLFTGRSASAIGGGLDDRFIHSPLEKNKVKGKTFTLLSVGHLVERKGFDTVIRSLADIGPELADWRYIIIGEGPCRLELEHLVSKEGLNQHIHLLGSVSLNVLMGWYRSADIFIMVSRFIEHKGDVEGLGLVYMEAGAFGLPVIAGDSGGVGDVVKNHVNGLLVEPGSVDSVSCAILRLYREPELRERLGSEGRGLAEKKWRWKHTAEKLLRSSGVYS